MSSLSGRRLNLNQALAIQANQYRSADNLRDYWPEEIDERINEIRANQSEKANRMALKRFEVSKRELASIPTSDQYAAITVKLQTGLPPVIKAKTEVVELVTEIHEFWKITKNNGGYEFLAIPPQIMGF